MRPKVKKAVADVEAALRKVQQEKWEETERANRAQAEVATLKRENQTLRKSVLHLQMLLRSAISIIVHGKPEGGP